MVDPSTCLAPLYDRTVVGVLLEAGVSRVQPTGAFVALFKLRNQLPPLLGSSVLEVGAVVQSTAGPLCLSKWELPGVQMYRLIAGRAVSDLLLHLRQVLAVLVPGGDLGDRQVDPHGGVHGIRLGVAWAYLGRVPHASTLTAGSAGLDHR